MINTGSSDLTINPALCLSTLLLFKTSLTRVIILAFAKWVILLGQTLTQQAFTKLLLLWHRHLRLHQHHLHQLRQ